MYVLYVCVWMGKNGRDGRLLVALRRCAHTLCLAPNLSHYHNQLTNIHLSHHNTPTNYTYIILSQHHHHSTQPNNHPQKTKVKRLRLCVADNEAFRAALSLLRVREAEEGELVRMLGTMCKPPR